MSYAWKQFHSFSVSGEQSIHELFLNNLYRIILDSFGIHVIEFHASNFRSFGSEIMLDALIFC